MTETTIQKGDKLEDRVHQFLLDQQGFGDLVYGMYPPHLCTIKKKAKYFCKERSGYIEFDVVIELRREASNNLHLVVVFECKNHKNNIPETYVTDFSDKLNRLFRHNGKGIIVSSKPLQKGARALADSRRLGIAKFDGAGLDIIAERRGSSIVEPKYVERQIFEREKQPRPLKFSAYFSGSFFSSIHQLLEEFEYGDRKARPDSSLHSGTRVPWVEEDILQSRVDAILKDLEYQSGPVDLEEICSSRKISIVRETEPSHPDFGSVTLGFANFQSRSITIFPNGHLGRERFTLAHEIGHFELNHDQFLRSEMTLENDLFQKPIDKSDSNLDRMEFQANAFASCLLLPSPYFESVVAHYRKKLGIRNRGFGYIFVDDQRDNYMDYERLLSSVSAFFETSKKAVDVKLKKMKLVNDARTF